MSSAFEVIECDGHDGWLKMRTCGIGGSDASAIIGMNPYKSSIDLFEEKTGRRFPEDISEKSYVKYGTEAEPLLRQMFALDHPEYKVSYHENRILRSRTHPFMQASLDGELEDENGRKGILEIKTSTINQPLQYEKWKGRIPDNYYAQVLHYLLVTGYQFVILRAHLFIGWRDDCMAITKDQSIERCEVEEDLQMLLREETRFWQFVEGGHTPPRKLPEI